MSSNTSSGSLQGWNDLCEDVCEDEEPVFKNRPSLLIGNGFSINIWSKFNYKYLYEEARNNFLTPEDKSLFDNLRTVNFEDVLKILALMKNRASTHHCQSLCLSIEDNERSIRNALIKTIRDVHIPSINFPECKSRSICEKLMKYNSIYYTNYDLLIYWSVMRYTDEQTSDRSMILSKFFDFFWKNPFDLGDTEIRKPEERSGIYYLHGGLHLYEKFFRESGEISDSLELLPQQTPANLSHQDFSGTQVSSDGGFQCFLGKTYKRTNDGRNILELFDNYSLDEIPLFISEGRYQDKFRSIRQSNYLKFLFQRFKNDTNPLVILGHKLGDSDKHIANAIKVDKNRHVAISVNNHGNINEKKKRFTQALQGMKNLHFFDAATHPLLGANLRVG